MVDVNLTYEDVEKMSSEEKFKQGILVYANDENDYVCEIWGGSTKHPDLVYHMNYDHDYKKGVYDDKYEVFQWLLYIASNLSSRQMAFELADYAIDNWLDIK